MSATRRPDAAFPLTFVSEWEFVSRGELPAVLAKERRWAVLIANAEHIDARMAEMTEHDGLHVHSVTVHAMCATCKGNGTVRDKRSRGPLPRLLACKVCKGKPTIWSGPASRGDHFPDEPV